jgi:Arc/MetJ-type ribon-helix-helix transcriptional regulator
MAKPTTIRIPEDLLNEIDQLVQELKLDRSVYLREVLRKGFSMDKQDRLLKKYHRRELSQMEVCEELGWNPWEFLTQIKAKSLHLNVDLEDWLDAAAIKA